jgi:hypothetical protein
VIVCPPGTAIVSAGIVSVCFSIVLGIIIGCESAGCVGCIPPGAGTEMSDAPCSPGPSTVTVTISGVESTVTVTISGSS